MYSIRITKILPDIFKGRFFHGKIYCNNLHKIALRKKTAKQARMDGKKAKNRQKWTV